MSNEPRKWNSIPCCKKQIRLDIILTGGQSFRWKEFTPGVWIGVMGGKVWCLTQDDSTVFYQVYEATGASVLQETEEKHSQDEESTCVQKKLRSACEDFKYPKDEPFNEKCDGDIKYENVQEFFEAASHLSDASKQCGDPALLYRECTAVKQAEGEANYEDILRKYFQLNVDIEILYEEWSAKDDHFKSVAGDFWGVRLLRQDPVENLFSIICASNNNLPRITIMVEKLCDHFGKPITEVNGHLYHDFPQVGELAKEGVEKKLRELGFGYRAEFIASSAKSVLERGGRDWVLSLREASHENAKSELKKLRGVGDKVADCVCLMSLNKTCAVPVDTHVWQFAAKHYLPGLKSTKTLTPKLYQEIGKHFQSLWGNYAGWAQCVLYAAELKHIQKTVAADIATKMPEPAATRCKQEPECSPKKQKYLKSSSSSVSEV